MPSTDEDRRPTASRQRPGGSHVEEILPDLEGLEVRPHSGIVKSPVGEPEILPLSLLGKWVAWSSDGLRILASAETSEEAECLAVEAGEPEPILHRPMALR